MRIAEALFRGEMPRLSARLLPAGYAQNAQGARLLSGDLEAWKDLRKESVQVRTGAVGQNTTAANLAKSAPINSLHLMAGQYWLHWTQAELDAIAKSVDAVLGPIPGDTTYKTYFTGAGGPRYTDIDLATAPANQGAAAQGAYPYKSVALGVAAPSAAPTVEQVVSPDSPDKIVKSYDGSDLSDWTQRNEGAFGWSISNADGNPLPSFFVNHYQKDWISRNVLSRTFGLVEDLAAFVIKADFKQIFRDAAGDLTIGLFCINDIPGAVNGPMFQLTDTGALDFKYHDGTGQSYALTTFAVGTMTTLEVTGTKNDTTGYFDIVANFKQGGITVSTISQRMKRLGDVFHLSVASGAGSGSQGSAQAIFDNLYFEFTPKPLPGEAPQFTTYVYTTVNSLGQESAPSPPSATVTEPSEFTLNKVTIPAQPGGADITKAYLYRAATSADGTSYLFVAEVLPAYPNTFDDDILTEDLDEPLATDGFDAPPADLQGLVALANGMLAGFSGNQLCLSEPTFPHAWPIKYRLTMSSKIVALGAIDNTILILTESNPYTAYGNTPAEIAASMTKEPKVAGCESKRSVGYLGTQIVYASPEGLVGYAGQGRLEIITRGFFTREQWQALNPPSIIGIVHDDRYYFWYQKLDGTKGGYILDQRQDGFGLVPLDFHVTAAFVNPLNDSLFMCIDQGDAYDGASLVTPPGNAVVQWNAAAQLQPYVWKSKKYLLDHPATFQYCQITALNYTSLTLKLYADGVLFLTRAVTSEKEFVLPPPTVKRATAFEFELSGTSPVNDIQIAESIDEIR